MRDYPEAVAGVVVYAGSEIVHLADDIVAVPWTVLAGAQAAPASPGAR